MPPFKVIVKVMVVVCFYFLKINYNTNILAFGLTVIDKSNTVNINLNIN